ncbi:Uncharacterised protein [Neisseria meningitidis]|nr:Uncharacterised protein [Neisseria meningitidis]
MGVTFVFGIDGYGNVAQQRFGTGGRHDNGFGRIVRQRIADMPHRALFFHAFYFQIRHRRAKHRIPVHQAFAAINQALFIQAYEHFGYGFGAYIVHCEILARPVGRTAHTAHLLRNRAAGNFFPFPHFFQEFFTTQVMTGHVLRGKLTLDHDLRGDARVVGAGNPGGVAAFHTVVAGQAVHNGLVEGMTHVQRAGYIGRRQLDGKRRFGQIHIRLEIALAFPVLIVLGFDFGGGVFV